jgi:hypothetical protein
MEPVYPKDNGSLKRAKERFLEKVKNWDWGRVDADEYQGKPKGRKAKEKKRVESKPRSEGEKRALEYQNKFFNFNK